MHDALQSFMSAILAALGHAPETIEPGRMHRFPTSNRRGDDAGWCKLFDDQRGGVFGCHRQGITETWCAVERSALTPAHRLEHARQVALAAAKRQAQHRQQWAENARRIARMWAECVPLLPGDPATLYLKRRGFGGVWPLPSCLRLHRALPYWHNGEKLGAFPTMVAPLVAADGRVVALHRTYLHADGRPVLQEGRKVKKLTRTAGSLAGACIPLHAPRSGVIGIAEGIETALAAWCGSAMSVVAAYSAGNLAAWQWPAGAQRIVIFADNDRAGRQAADDLRVRVARAGVRCDVALPSEDGGDWADVWVADREAATIDARSAA